MRDPCEGAKSEILTRKQRGFSLLALVLLAFLLSWDSPYRGVLPCISPPGSWPWGAHTVDWYLDPVPCHIGLNSTVEWSLDTGPDFGSAGSQLRIFQG